MEIFNSLITEIQELISVHKPLYYNNHGNSWNVLSHSEVILQRDTAFELNGTGFNLLTSSEIKDQVIILGNDLPDIKHSCRFVRISLIQTDSDIEAEKYYSLIKKTEYVKYHYFPEGFMLRSTSSSNKESVRVSENAVKNGINFRITGSLLIEQYKNIPEVKSAAVIYITSPEIDFEYMESMSVKVKKITETLNYVVNNINFDCDSCNLKAICDEVEGMRMLHFKLTD